MTLFIRLSAGGMVNIPCAEKCPDCGRTGKSIRSRTPGGKEPLAISGDPEGAEYYCSWCGADWSVVI